MISPGVFSFFQNFEFLGCYGGKRAKNSQKWEIITSVTHHISRTIHHLMMNFVTHMQNDISGTYFHFFRILFFWAVFFLGCKRAENSRKWEIITSVIHHISGTVHHLIIIFGTRKWNDDISRLFFIFFKILIFWAVREWKGKEWPKIKNNYICHALYLRNNRTSSDHKF